MTEIDFGALRAAAAKVMTRAYAPYSGFAVGAAAITRGGDLVTGCNVENVSYGLGLCAEVAMVSSGVSTGVLRAPQDHSDYTLMAVAVCDADGRPLTPCGRCRQVLREFGDDAVLIDGVDGPRTLGELLPDAFGPEHLARIRRENR